MPHMGGRLCESGSVMCDLARRVCRLRPTLFDRGAAFELVGGTKLAIQSTWWVKPSSKNRSYLVILGNFRGESNEQVREEADSRAGRSFRSVRSSTELCPGTSLRSGADHRVICRRSLPPRRTALRVFHRRGRPARAIGE